VHYTRRDLPDRIESLQLLNLGFGDLPLRDLRAQLPVGLLQFTDSNLNAALEPLFEMFAMGRHAQGNVGPACRRANRLRRVSGSTTKWRSRLSLSGPDGAAKRAAVTSAGYFVTVMSLARRSALGRPSQDGPMCSAYPSHPS
jgi:hypothetical protein